MPTLAPGAQQYQDMLDGGVPVADAAQWQSVARDQMARGGVPPADLDKYWGTVEPDMSDHEAQIKANLAKADPAKTGQSFPDAWAAGLGIGADTLLAKGPPQIKPDPNNDWMHRFVTDLGSMAGSAYTAATGAAAGFVAGEAAFPAGGGLLGAAAGAFMLPQAVRQSVVDHYEKGDIRTWQDFATRSAGLTFNTLAAGAQGAAVTLAGPAGEAGAAALNVPKWAVGAAAPAAVAATLAESSALSKGNLVPDAEDAAIGATALLGAAVGHLYGATQRLVMSRPGATVAAHLNDIYVDTGAPPKAAAAAGAAETSVKDEILAPTAADGTRLTPQIKALAPPEPPPFEHPAEPTPTATSSERTSLWQLSPDELQARYDEENLDDHAQLLKALGSEEAVREFNRLDRMQNSSDPDRADRGAALFDEKFGNLTPEQERLVYGVRGNFASAEEIKMVLDAHSNRSEDPLDAAYEAALAIRKTDPKDLLSVPEGLGTVTAQAAYVRLRNAYEDMKNAGVPAPEIGSKIVDALVQRGGWKRGDAEEIVGRFTEKAREKAQEKTTTTEPPNTPLMPTGEVEAQQQTNLLLEFQGEPSTPEPPPPTPPEPPEPPAPGEPEPAPDWRAEIDKMIAKEPVPPGLALRSVQALRRGIAEFQSELTPYVEFGKRVDRMLPLKLTQLPDGDLAPTRELHVNLEDLMRHIYAARDQAAQFIRDNTLSINPEKEEVSIINPKDPHYLMKAYELLEKNGVDLEDFRRWRMIQSTLDRRARGIKTGVSDETAMAGLQDPAMIKADPLFREANDIIQKVKGDALQWMVDTGRLSFEQRQAMMNLNPYHVNWRRQIDPSYQGASVPRGLKNRQTLYRAKGGDEPIKDPMLTDVDNLTLMIAEGNRNLASGFIKKLAVGYPDLAKAEGIYLKETIDPAADHAPLQITDENGDPVPPAAAAGLGAIVAERKYMGRVGPNDIVHWDDGKMEIWHINDPDLAAGLRVPSPMPVWQLLRLAGTVAGWQRAGIMGEFGNAIRGLTHGQYGALVAPGKFMLPWQDIMVGLMDSFGPKAGEAMARARANGTFGTAMVAIDRDYIKNDVAALYDKTGSWNAVWNYTKNPLQTSRMLAHWITSRATGGRQIANVGAGYTPMRAAAIAVRSHLDFRERQASGMTNAVLRTMTFGAVDIKTIEQLARGAQENPLRTALVLASTVMAATLLFAFNHKQDEDLPPGERYSDIPDQQRQMFWNFPVVAGARLRLFAPYVQSTFSKIPAEHALRWWANDNPKEFSDWRDTLLTSFWHPTISTILTPGAEDWANKHIYNGQPIIPAGLEGQSDWAQYEASTTTTAKKLAQVLGPPNLNVMNFSPMMLENWVKGLLGSAPLDAIHLLERPFNPVGRPWEAADLPFLGVFFARHNYGMSSQPIQDFFEGSDDIIKGITTLNTMIERGAVDAVKEGREPGSWTPEITAAVDALGLKHPPGMALSDVLQSREYAEMASLSSTQEAFRTAGGLLRGINDSKMTNGEKRKWTDSITHGMVAAADAANLKLKAIKSGNVAAFEAAQAQESTVIGQGLGNLP